MGSHGTPPTTKRHPDSPVVPKFVHASQPYLLTNDLQGARDAVLQELGSSIPQTTFDEFLARLAPLLPDVDFNAIIQSLGSGPDPALVSGRWSSFPNNPKDTEGKEDKVFNPMPEIFTKVVKAIIPYLGGNREPTVDFLQNPNRAPTSIDIKNDSRPDGYFTRKDRERVLSTDKTKEEIFWADIALSFEYKLADGPNDLADNVRKCIWSLQHVMRDDPRRRASFAMTIENTTTRLWFCCRSWVIVSEPFDFIEDPLKFVKFIAAFAFADYRSLGFDPTVELVSKTEAKYVISVHHKPQKPRKFETKRTLSSYGAEPLRGRGTRVFEVVEIDENNNSIDSPVVLKDIWIDSDRTREGQILASLYETADGKDKNLIEELFLTTICHGNVLIDDNALEDTTKALMRGLDIPSNKDLWYTLPTSHGQIRKGSGSETVREGTCARAPHTNPLYEPKTHYRIVFKELCTPIHDIKNLNTVLEILKDIVKALQALRNKGLVHRDVSTGNILSYNGHGKLADLEYAKEMSDLTSHNMRTGTMDFMAIEVAAQQFLFRPSNPTSDLTGIDSDTEEIDLIDAAKKINLTQVPFFHNHLHDLESLWWVAVWVVFFNNFSEETTSPDHSSITLQDAESQIKKARKVFPPTLDSATRQNTFQTPDKFLQICNGLPSNKSRICGHLEVLRRRLITNYFDIEKEYPHHLDPNSSSIEIYDSFIKVFTKLQTSYSGFKLEFIPRIQKRLLAEKSKRPRSDTMDVSGVPNAKR